MNILFLVNDSGSIGSGQTTAMLIQAALRQEHRVCICGVRDLSCPSDGHPVARACVLDQAAAALSLQALVQHIASIPRESITMDELDVMMIRTNPARDLAHQGAHTFALSIARRCKHTYGLSVFNDPEGLYEASSKLYLMGFSETVRPATLVSAFIEEIREFVDKTSGPCVVKPLQGTRGRDVFFIQSAKDRNFKQIVDVVLREGLVMVQEYVPGAEEGDTRVVVMDGDLLTINGKVAAIRRRPGADDFRSNLHAGGHAEPAVITPAMKHGIALMSDTLRKDGLFLVGLDFIGDKVIELNVFSTGGLRDAERFEGVSFTDEIINAVERIHMARAR